MHEPLMPIKEIISRLKSSASAERKEHSKGYFPTSMEVVGVSVPNLRAIVKDIGTQIKDRSPDVVLPYAMQIIGTGIFECRQIGYEIIAGHRETMESLGIGDLNNLGEGMDNWASVDTFSVMISGPTWREGRVPDRSIVAWTRSKNPWWRRAAVVSTVALNSKARGGTGDPERTIDICSRVIGDRHPMVTKALSWALRELTKRDIDRVESFLSTHRDKIAPLVIREVRKKIDTGRK